VSWADARPAIIAVLPSHNLAISMEFYGRLGVEVQAMGQDYAVAAWGHNELFHVRAIRDLDPNTNPTMLFVHVEDPDAWHTELVSRGIVAALPVDEPWGVREFRFDDPSGNTLRIGRGLS